MNATIHLADGTAVTVDERTARAAEERGVYMGIEVERVETHRRGALSRLGEPRCLDCGEPGDECACEPHGRFE